MLSGPNVPRDAFGVKFGHQRRRSVKVAAPGHHCRQHSWFWEDNFKHSGVCDEVGIAVDIRARQGRGWKLFMMLCFSSPGKRWICLSWGEFSWQCARNSGSWFAVGGDVQRWFGAPGSEGGDVWSIWEISSTREALEGISIKLWQCCLTLPQPSRVSTCTHFYNVSSSSNDTSSSFMRHVASSTPAPDLQRDQFRGQGVIICLRVCRRDVSPGTFLKDWMCGWRTSVSLLLLPRSPFGLLSQSDLVSNLVPAGGNFPASSPVVASHPFVGVSTQGGQPPATVQFSEGGPVRLTRFTRFVKMTLDSYYAHLNQMISQGRFEHIGRASIRLEGASAWGVRLRIDQWSSVLGNRPRLRCGVLYPSNKVFALQQCVFPQTSSFRIKKLCCMCLRTTKQWSIWSPKERRPTKRRVSRTHRVALDWLLDRTNLDSKKSKSSTSTPKTNLLTS